MAQVGLAAVQSLPTMSVEGTEKSVLIISRLRRVHLATVKMAAETPTLTPTASCSSAKPAFQKHGRAHSKGTYSNWQN